MLNKENPQGITLGVPKRKEKTPQRASSIEIIKLVAKGLHNREIASALGIKVRTVNFHVSNILLKLGVSTRLEAVLTWVNAHNETLYL